MTFEEALKKLFDSPEFKDWNKDEYLTHGFLGEGGWEIGFYNPEKDIVSTFEIGEVITKRPDSEAFKDGGTIAKLEHEKIEINLDEALTVAKGLLEAHYKNPAIMKKIIIIQNLEEKNLYNFTFLTQAFKALNIKIDAQSGKIVSHKIVDIMSKQ